MQPTDATRDALAVLVVDDSADCAKMLGMLLQAWGCEVRIAHKGADALKQAIEFRPDVILLDIGLPDQNGYEIAREIRRDSRIQDVLLIAITGFGQDKDRERSKAAGFDRHLTKPVASADLQELLGELRGARRRSSDDSQ